LGICVCAIKSAFSQKGAFSFLLMPTIAFYIDESGTPDSHTVPIVQGQTPIFTLSGIGFPLANWRERDRDYLRLKRYYFPDKMNKPYKRDEEIEIKGNELTSPRNARKSRNIAFIKGVLRYITKFGGTGFGVTFVKNNVNPASSRSLYTHGLQILVERFNLFLEEHPDFNHGIIILDSRLAKIIGDRHDLEVARSHMSFIFGHAEGRTCEKIMEPPLFGDSRLSVGIQICDIFSSLLFTNHYHYYTRKLSGAPDYSHNIRFWPDLKKIEFKSTQPHIHYNKYGYRVVRLDLKP
jgi:Protein of unknown function (DUF3800)